MIDQSVANQAIHARFREKWRERWPEENSLREEFGDDVFKMMNAQLNLMVDSVFSVMSAGLPVRSGVPTNTRILVKFGDDPARVARVTRHGWFDDCDSLVAGEPHSWWPLP